MTICKVGLNPHQIIEWGRREATRHPERTYELHKQPITRTGVIKYCKDLEPFTKPNEPKAAHKGVDFDIDVTRQLTHLSI